MGYFQHYKLNIDTFMCFGSVVKQNKTKYQCCVSSSVLGLTDISLASVFLSSVKILNHYASRK